MSNSYRVQFAFEQYEQLALVIANVNIYHPLKKFSVEPFNYFDN